MDYLPIFCRLDNKPVLLVGGGEVAERKARLLLDAGAQLTVVAPELDPELAELAANGSIEWLAGEFAPQQLTGKWLVVAATDRREVNALVYQSANQARIFANVVDDPKRSSFIMPSIIDRSPLMVAISSGGKAPVLARLLREKLEALLPQHLGQHRGLAAGGDGHHQRRAVDDRRHDEAGAFRVVHHVGKDPRLIRALVNQRIHLAPIGGGHYQPLARQLRRREFTGQPLDAAVGSQFRQLGVELGRYYCELGTGIQQQTRLALRYLAAADQQHGFVVESAKDGQVVHGAS